MSKEIVVGIHGYQPPRKAFHKEFVDIDTDPTRKDWTQIIDSQCYQPLAEMGLLSLTSHDFVPVLLSELERRASNTVNLIKNAGGENAVGTSYIHPILPDLTNDDKRIVIGAGVQKFQNMYGRKPSVFWPPETAMDMATAEQLADYGYQAFICGPHQIQLREGGDVSNIPVRIQLSRGRSIIAIPFDEQSSKSFAFENKRYADQFAGKYVFPSMDRLLSHQRYQLITWTDMETFGHHDRGGAFFLNYLLKEALPKEGFFPISVNNIDLSSPTEGKLYERSAWSCLHGGLVRWSEGCACTGPDNNWKRNYYEAFRILNQTVGGLVRQGLGSDYLNKMIGQFERGFRNPGPPHTQTEESLIAAKVAALVARTSCATFFADPHTSGHINILFGLVALQHLRDAGLVRDADMVEEEFMQNLSKFNDPKDYSKTGKNMAENLLHQKPLRHK